MKRFCSILIYLSITASFFTQTEIFQTELYNNLNQGINNLREGIVPSLSPTLGGVFPMGYLIATFFQKNPLATNSRKLYGLIGTGIIGISFAHWLYSRTAERIEKQAYRLLEEIEDEAKPFGIKKSYNRVQSENDVDYALILTEFCADIQYPQDLNSKIKHLKLIDDYFYRTLQKVKWLTPKLKQLKKDDDRESICNLYEKLNWYHRFIRNLRNKCIEQMHAYEDQMILRQNNRVAAEQQKINMEYKKDEIEHKKDANRRENIKWFRELRKVLYDWRWLISSGMVLSGGSETIRNLCKRYPKVAIVLGLGIGGTLFSVPLPNGK